MIYGENWHGFTFGIRTTEAIEPTVPEPGVIALFGLGLVGIALHRRNRKSTAH